jgi:hypothetical protein
MLGSRPAPQRALAPAAGLAASRAVYRLSRMSAAGQHSGEVGEVWDWQANDANRLQSAQIHAASEWNRKTDRAHVFGFATPWLHPPGETVAVLVLL